ncbi:excalibur calcium-binding domain-containing protein [Geminicoccus roseus]|uniref:excalibur calcium-binding domain-containing protein n=1 Tax=Geminicoccus roseus TaxID=404900 RepID=UPI0003F9FCAC|nr:excalibur calcium-binding domain-containing protein [Geminicoccus roseus]
MFDALGGWGRRRKPPLRLVHSRPRLGSAPPPERLSARLARRWRRWRNPVLYLLALAVIYAALMLGSPWDQLTTLKHYAAGLNCASARAVGLAPARRGEPGYWWRNDRDGDGEACEVWPR